MKKEIDWEKVRKWQVRFEVHRPFAALPRPDVIVEEVQNSPLYRLDGRGRDYGGGQISITLKGRGAIRIAGINYELTPGMAFLHVHNNPDICYYYPPDGTEEWHFLWISFEGGTSTELISEVNQRYGYLFDVSLNSPLVAKLMAFKNYPNEIQVLSPLEAGLFSLDMLNLLCSSKESERLESAHSSLIRDVQSVIIAEIANHLSTESLSKRFHISREHLSRTFKKVTGETLQEYIARTRLRMAIDLLLQTRLTAKEIAASCGYTEYSIFYRTFCKRLGLSPEELRKRGFRPGLQLEGLSN
ncbi:MAG: AraC family transcriptional regulator [Victivallales bacterium]|jgi:AraC-like DNA-binding protein|nr:AraC family transcriptional regulator [Victivallales bacterium]